MSFYLAIDGGGTKTTCGVADEARLLGIATSAGCNPVRHGIETARAAVRAAILEACAKTGVSPLSVTSTCLGVAGISAPGAAAMFREAISRTASGEVVVVADHTIAFDAAFGAASGILTIAGTGSLAFGRNESGEEARAGGHGFAISDEGSGQWIGRSAVSAVLRELDSGAAPRLYRVILEAWNIEPAELIRTANSVAPQDFAGLCPLVIQAAEEGDSVAAGVLCRAGEELAGLAHAVLTRLFPQNAPVSVRMAGGVLQNAKPVRDSFAVSLRALAPHADCNPEIVNPLLGAIAIARRLAGHK